MPIGKSFDKLTDSDKLAILDRVRQYYDLAVTGNSDLMKRMAEQDRYAIGKHWDDAFVAQQEERNRLCITVNLIAPQIKQLLGHVVQNPRDIVMYNSRGGLQVLADLQTALIEHAMSDQNARHQQIQWAEQGITTGCSYLALFINKDVDPRGGALEVMRLNEFDCLPDPSCQVYDINTRRLGARFFIWEPYEDRAYVEKKWPGALSEYGLASETNGKTMNGLISWFVGGVVGTVHRLWNWGRETDGFTEQNLRIPVRHCWWVDYTEVYHFYDLRTDELDAIILTDPKEIKAAKNAAAKWPEQFELHKAISPVMNHTVSLGAEVLLDHIVDELNLLQTGQTLYPVVGFHANFNNGYKAGITEAMIGPNTWFNWMRSTAINIMKNQPNSGWIVGGGTDAEKQWLEAHGGEDGIVIDRSKFGNEVTKIDPAPLPQFEALAEMGKSEVKEVVNMHVDTPEDEPKSMSGFALRMRQQKAITGISPVLSNFDYSLVLWGQLMAAAIRCNDVYSPAEIREIMDEKDLLDPQLLQECRQAVATAMGFVLPPQPKGLDPLLVTQLDPAQASTVKAQYEKQLGDYQLLMQAIDAKAKPMAIMALIDAMHNARRGRYQCRVSLSAEGVTQRARTMLEVAEVNQLLVANQQPPLSDKYIIDASDLPKKDDVLSERGYGK